MKMKRIVYAFLAGLMTVVVLHIGLFYVNLGKGMEEERYIDEWLQVKDRAALAREEPTLFFVSGSNTLFGIDTAEIERQLGIPVVNYGVHASLKSYLFPRVERVLQPGDIVILPVEYGFYGDETYGLEEVRYITGYDPKIFYAMPFSRKVGMIFHYPAEKLLQDAWHQVWPMAPKESGYSSKYLNENGDMTNNKMEDRKSDEELLAKAGSHIFPSERPTLEAKARLHDFIAWCHANDIEVYAAWPAYLTKSASPTEQDDESIQRIRAFYAEEGVRVIGDCIDGLYDVRAFYDTSSHLNENGKRVRTEYFLNHIRAEGIDQALRSNANL